MPNDEHLNQRMRLALEAHIRISEMRMMGGTCFFLNGNMLCGARRDKDGFGRFMFRVGKAKETEALSNPFANPIVHGKRKLGGFVVVDEADCDPAALGDWLSLCLAHAASLPPKS